MKEYNTTQLSPDKVFERHVYHRDQFAHYLRWTHVLKVIPPKVSLLDVGCGDANMLKVLYHNRHVPYLYLGIDVRTKTIFQNREIYKTLPWAKFENKDFCKPQHKLGTFEFVTCLEVLEHIGKQNGEQFLMNIAQNMSNTSKCFISSPCYNGIDVAQNHIINGEISEYTFSEMKWLLEKIFHINCVWGTFASQKDYLGKLTPEQFKLWNQLSEYYDSNLVSVIFAPLFPAQARNCLWEVSLK